jgi:hypothetical protein
LPPEQLSSGFLGVRRSGICSPSNSTAVNYHWDRGSSNLSRCQWPDRPCIAAEVRPLPGCKDNAATEARVLILAHPPLLDPVPLADIFQT